MTERYVIRGIAPHKYQTTDGARARARLDYFRNQHPNARLIVVRER